MSLNKSIQYLSSPVNQLQSLSDNFQGVSVPSSPSLVHIGRSGAFQRIFKPWSKFVKRRYGQMLSWVKEARGRGCQLLRMDLTTASNIDKNTLKKHFQELRRRIEKKYGYRIEFYKIVTSEGFGVYHLILAIEWARAVWIPQAWLSEQWDKIHGSKIVYIRRMGNRKRDDTKVASYLCCQYLADQDKHVRVSWSWWRSRLAIGKSWNFLKRQIMSGFSVSSWMGRSPFNRLLTYQDLLRAWDEILSRGWSQVANATIFISNRSLDIVFQ
jgi:hypothetical protein